MASHEQAILADIMLMIGKRFPNSIRIWRNNTGAFKDATGRMVKYGCPGSPDLLGIIKGGHWLGIEVKDKGKQSPQQKDFQKMIESMGGFYRLFTSVEQAEGELSAIVDYYRTEPRP